MGFPCERVRHKIKYRENNNCIRWSDDIDDHLQAKINTDQSNTRNERLYMYHHHDHPTANDTVSPNRCPQKPIGHGFVKRITQLISFNPGHQGSTPSATETTAASTTASTTVTSHSQYLVRQSLCLYAASSFILVLCYFATSATAAEAVHPMFAEGKSDKEILDHLLKNSRYDKRLLPPVDDADFCCGMDTPENAKSDCGWQPGRTQNRDTLTVNVSVLLLSLASPDESSLKYEVEFLLQQQWYDPRLRYANQSHYEYLNAIHHHEDIWLPDTYFIMHGDFKDPLIPMHFALRIYRNGTINYLMRRHLILSCQGRLNIFPFDDPLCSFALESISYELSHVTYVWKNDEDTLRKSPSLTTLNAYLIQNATTACPIKASWRGNYSCLKVDLIFTRDRAFYFTTVFIPGIILVTSSFITFWLEWNAVPARVMIGVTTMLNFFTTSNGFRGTLPVVSNLTAMNVWDGVCMGFIYASLLEFVCVNYVGRKRPLHNVVYRPGENPVTQRLPAVLSRIGVILASPLDIIESEFLAATTPDKNQSQGSQQKQQSQHQQPSLDIQNASSNLSDADMMMIGSIKPMAKSSSNKTLKENRPSCSYGNGNINTDNDEDETNQIQQKIPYHCRMHCCHSHGQQAILMQQTNESEEEEHGAVNIPIEMGEFCAMGFADQQQGEKRREPGPPNEIVACTSCAGSSSPCTHTANNGCATETCFVQVRKKEPPHPIRKAKTIDVIARITFPIAYSIFLIFFFIHYKGVS